MFFQSSNIPAFQPPEVKAAAKEIPTVGSRFQQWFTRQSPPAAQPGNEDSRRSSLQDEILLGNIMKSRCNITGTVRMDPFRPVLKPFIYWYGWNQAINCWSGLDIFIKWSVLELSNSGSIAYLCLLQT
jgi:hypothetical protein